MREALTQEIQHKLERFADTLTRWQGAINLVSSTENIWERHVEDSLQLLPHISPKASQVADMGSGAGFPGLILAIAGLPHVTLIESDKRKAAFLTEAARVCDTPVRVLNQRLEQVSDVNADYVTARGCASLSQLFHLSRTLRHEKSTCLFLKGKNYTKEIEEARRDWSFDLEIFPSALSDGVILKLTKVQQRGD